MDLEQGFAFLVFSLVAAITPGPSNVMLTATGAIAGVLRGLPCLFGVSAGMGLLMFAVALGLGALVLGDPLVLKILNWLGAAFLLWLSWKIATAKHGASEAKEPVGFWKALVFQWINPKAWMVSSAAAGAYLKTSPGGPLLQAVLLAAVFIIAALPSGLVWLAFGASMRRILQSERSARLFNVIMGGTLAASVIFIVW